jgi:integrase
LSEARAHVARVKADRVRGALPIGNITFDEVADAWLSEKNRKGLREVTLRGYRDSLSHARRAFGPISVERVTRNEVEQLAKEMQDSGLAARTTNLCLGLVRAVLERSVAEGHTIRNVAQSVTAHSGASAKRIPLTLEEGRKVAEEASRHRLHAAWLLTLSGLRRSEVLGLKWRDINGEKGTINICRSRVMVGGAIHVGPSKTQHGTRTLPIPQDVISAMRTWKSQVASSLGVGMLGTDIYVFLDEAGTPVRPEWYSDEWVRLCHKAGIERRVKLHEARHYSVVTMRTAGLPDRLVAAWHGHDEVTMRRTYDHANLDIDGLASIGRALEALRSDKRTG